MHADKVGCGTRAVFAGERDIEKIFIPALLECPPRGKNDPSHCCLYEQQLADMLKSELGPHLITAQFVLGDGILDFWNRFLLWHRLSSDL